MFYNIKKVCSTTYFLRDALRAWFGARQRASRTALPSDLVCSARRRAALSNKITFVRSKKNSARFAARAVQTMKKYLVRERKNHRLRHRILLLPAHES